MNQSYSYNDSMEAELEEIRHNLETIRAFANGTSIPFTWDRSRNQEQSSSGQPYRKPISRLVWLLIIGGLSGGTIAVIAFMKANDIRFVQGEPGDTPVTVSELKLHNTPADCWVALHGDVYDLTSYAKRHPGGGRVVTDLAGMDGTQAYDIFHTIALLDSVRGDVIGPLVVGDQSNGGSNSFVDDDDHEGTDKDCESDSTCVTLEELRIHSTPDDCWVVLYGNVYDLTFYAAVHPGGSRILTKLAGSDGTANYDVFHPIELLQTLQRGELIGRLHIGIAGTLGPSPTSRPSTVMAACEDDSTCVTASELEQHNTATDCWIAIHGNVYDLTNYARRHPGGAQVVTIFAGTDATAGYTRFHSGGLLATLQSDELIGRLDGNVVGVASVFNDERSESISEHSLD